MCCPATGFGSPSPTPGRCRCCSAGRATPADRRRPSYRGAGAARCGTPAGTPASRSRPPTGQLLHRRGLGVRGCVSPYRAVGAARCGLGWGPRVALSARPARERRRPLPLPHGGPRVQTALRWRGAPAARVQPGSGGWCWPADPLEAGAIGCCGVRGWCPGTGSGPSAPPSSRRRRRRSTPPARAGLARRAVSRPRRVPPRVRWSGLGGLVSGGERTVQPARPPAAVPGWGTPAAVGGAAPAVPCQG